jgi:hypothetical protein
MRRRTFLQIPAVASAAATDELPKYKIVSSYHAQGKEGMPGLYPGQVISVHSKRAIDAATEKVDTSAVAEMIRRGMTELTGEKSPPDAWRKFFSPNDVIGIKLNCSGAPQICSNPHVVAEIVRNLMSIGIKANQITLYERFLDQVVTVKYPQYLPEGVNIGVVGSNRAGILGYDPKTYVEVNFFGEEDTRSNLNMMVVDKFTKIINVPNMKDHGASGVTGCLKNIAYGSFHNVARSHQYSKTNTLSFIGTLASVEPLRSKTVLSIMDGLKAVWQGGPFAPDKKFCFYPGQIMFGTDPVAMDRLLLDIIDDERKRKGAPSVWERTTGKWGRYVREPGHIEYASKLGLGEYDKNKIKLKEFTVA